MTLPVTMLPTRLSGDGTQTTYQFDPLTTLLAVPVAGHAPYRLCVPGVALDSRINSKYFPALPKASQLPVSIRQTPLGHAAFPTGGPDPNITVSLGALAVAAAPPPGGGPPIDEFAHPSQNNPDNISVFSTPVSRPNFFLPPTEVFTQEQAVGFLQNSDTIPVSDSAAQMLANDLRIAADARAQAQFNELVSTRSTREIMRVIRGEQPSGPPAPATAQRVTPNTRVLAGGQLAIVGGLYFVDWLTYSPITEVFYIRDTHAWDDTQTTLFGTTTYWYIYYSSLDTMGTLKADYTCTPPNFSDGNSAVIVAGAVITCASGDCVGLTVGGQDRSPQAAVGGATLTLTGPLFVRANANFLAGSTLTASGTMTVAGSINFNGTTVALSGTLTAGSNPATQGVNVTNGSVLTITGGTVNGYISVSSLSSVILAANSTFNCSAGLGGTLDVATYTLTITGTAAIQCELRLQDGGQVNVSDTVNLIGLTVTIPLNFTPAPETIFLSTPDISPTAGQKLVPLRDGTPPDPNNDHWGYSGGLVRDVYTLSDGKDYHLKCYRTSVALSLKMKNNADAVIWCINGNAGTVDVASAQNAAGEKVLDPVGSNVYVKGINNNSVYYDWQTAQRPLDLPVVLRHGTVGVADQGSVITYTPEANPQFVEGFTANLDDILGDEDSDGGANVTVSAVPIDDTPEIEVVTGGMVTINIPFLKDASTLTPTKGSASSPSGGAFDYTAGMSAGLDTFHYTALFNGYENSDCNVNVRINSVTGPMHTGSIPNAAPSSLDLVQVSSDSAAAEPSVDEEKDEEDE